MVLFSGRRGTVSRSVFELETGNKSYACLCIPHVLNWQKYMIYGGITMEKEELDYEKTAMRISLVSIVSNVILSLLNVLAGVGGHSGGVSADVNHSA